MQIRDLRDGMRRVDVEGEIVNISEPRTVNLRTGGEAHVADAIIRDLSGEIKFTMWDDQLSKVTVGSIIRITNGYTNSFRGEVRIQTGKYGELEVLGQGSGVPS